MSKKNEQWLFENRVDTRELVQVLELAKATQKVCCVLGPAGSGKSELVHQFSNKYYGKDAHVVLLSHYDTTDLVGQSVPVQSDGKLFMRLAQQELIPIDPDWKGVLFLDEITNIDSQMAHVLYQLVHERKLGGKDLPKGMQIVLAGNRVFDNGSSNEILGPLANRLMVVELQPKPQHWLEDYADMVGVHPAIYQYVHTYPDELFEYGAEDDCPAFSSGRSMKAASDILHSLDNKICSQKIASYGIDGVLGNNKFLKIYPFYEAAMKLPKAIDILEGTNTRKINSNDVGLAGIYSVLSGCMFYLTQEVQKNKQKAVRYGQNLIKFLNENLVDEQEIMVNFTNKLLTVGTDNNFPQFLMNVRKDCLEFGNILVNYSNFKAGFEEIMKQAA